MGWYELYIYDADGIDKVSGLKDRLTKHRHLEKNTIFDHNVYSVKFTSNDDWIRDTEDMNDELFRDLTKPYLITTWDIKY